MDVTVDCARDLNISGARAIRDVWAHTDEAAGTEIKSEVPGYYSRMFVLHPRKEPSSVVKTDGSTTEWMKN